MQQAVLLGQAAADKERLLACAKLEQDADEDAAISTIGDDESKFGCGLILDLREPVQADIDGPKAAAEGHAKVEDDSTNPMAGVRRRDMAAHQDFVQRSLQAVDSQKRVAMDLERLSAVGAAARDADEEEAIRQLGVGQQLKSARARVCVKDTE